MRSVSSCARPASGRKCLHADTMRCFSEQVIKFHFPPPVEEFFDPYAKGEQAHGGRLFAVTCALADACA